MLVAALLALVGWLPIALWAATSGRLTEQAGGESLLQHYGVHVRCLLVVPLLVVAGPRLRRSMQGIAARLGTLVQERAEQRARLDALNRGALRWHDAALPWVLAAGVALAWSIVDRPHEHGDAMAWAMDDGGAIGFGGWWFGYVARPIFLALLLAWLWRLLVVTAWFWRIGRLELPLVPTHPDRCGGIAFVEKLPAAFALVTLALAATLASRWAHEILHHGASLASYRQPVALFAAGWTLLLWLPLLGLAPLLSRERKRALGTYSALVGRQGRLVHRRWIDGEPVGAEPILEAPEIGPVADAAALYEAVERMRPVPIGKLSLVTVAVPLALPLLAAAALQVPLKDLLLKLAQVLV